MKKKIIVMLILAFMPACIKSVNAQSGSWAGELSVMGTKLPLVFHFDKGSCTIDSPKQGAKGIPAEWVYEENGDVNVNIPSIRATYKGKYDGKEIKGTFTQSGMGFQLDLSHDETAASGPKRPQTPVAPFPYTTEEVTCTFGQYTLHGTLSLPEDFTSETPLVIMVTGSGMQNRDEEILCHKPFAVIADALARNGIASLRYDDCGYGDKSFNSEEYTIHDHAKDAESWVKLLSKRFKNIGVLGHSEGGTIALILAEEGKVGFAISLAGVAVSGSETLKKQNEQILIGSGVPTNIANDYGKALDKIYANIIEGKNIDQSVYSEVPDMMKPNMDKLIKELSTPYFKDFLSTDVSKNLSKVKCPVLALGGKKDIQVDCQSNLDAIDKGLNHSQHKVVAFDGLNHLFQHCQTGMPNEYGEIEETISPEVLTTIIDWIKKK